MRQSKRLLGLLIGYAVAQLPAAAVLASASQIQELVDAKGAQYVVLRDSLLKQDTASIKSDVRAAGVDQPWQTAMLEKVLGAWSTQRADMLALQSKVRAWGDLPSMRNAAGDPVIVIPPGTFDGLEDVLEAGMAELVWKLRPTLAAFDRPEVAEIPFRVLGRIRAQDSAPLLASVAADEHETVAVRRAALDALRSIRSAAVVNEVVTLARSDPNAEIRSLAVEVLGYTRDATGLAVVEEIAKSDNDQGVRQAAELMLLLNQASTWP